MIPGLIVLIIISSLVLIKSADLVVISLRRISESTKTGVYALTAILLALGTSLPEMFVAITSALEGVSNLSFGNVLGANIANISLIAGLAGLVVGRVQVHGGYLKRDVGIALVAGVIPLVLTFDGLLSRIDGLILITIYGSYATNLFNERYLEIAEQQKKEGLINRFFRKLTDKIEIGNKKVYGKLMLGITMLLVSADIIVKIAQYLATEANLPVFLIGLIVLSVGTTLPEIAFSFRSLEDHEPMMFFGNILGSVIANSTIVLGIAAVITPIRIVAFDGFFKAAIFFLLIFLLFWFFIRSKHRLDRWETGLLLVMYLSFVISMFLT